MIFIETPPPAPPRLRARASIAAAFKLIKAEWRTCLKIIAFPVFLAVAIGFANSPPIYLKMLFAQNLLDIDSVLSVCRSTTVDIPNECRSAMPPVLAFLLSIGSFYFLIIANILLLRFFILGEKPPGMVVVYHPQIWPRIKAVVKIILGVFGTAAVAAIPASIIFRLPIPASIILGIFWILGAAICVTILGARWFLAPVAAAVGEDSSLKNAWHKTHGQVWRITTAQFLWGLCITGIILCLFLALFFSPIPVRWLLLILIVLILNIMVPIASAAFNSILYGHFYRGMVVKQSENES